MDDRVERERIVGAGREAEAQLEHVRTSSTSPGSMACSAPRASLNIQRPRSCSSTSFETTRTSTCGHPRVLRRAQDAVALHRLDVRRVPTSDETARRDRAHERAGERAAGGCEQPRVRDRDRIRLRAQAVVRVDRLAADHHREQRDPGRLARAGDADVQYRLRALRGERATRGERGSDRPEPAGERPRALERRELTLGCGDDQDHGRRIGGSESRPRTGSKMQERPPYHPRGTPDE